MDRIIRARFKRKGKAGSPSSRFSKQFVLWIEGEEELRTLNISKATTWLIQRSLVISTVTAMEVYFREMLDGIYRMCRPESFESKFRDLHKNKYDIDEILELYKNSVNPCELVLDGLSFQRIDNIERVFGGLLGKPFWKSVLPVKVRVANRPETETEVGTEDLEAFQRLLQLRHELVHDPDHHKQELSKEEEGWIHRSSMLIIACDIVLNDFIIKNMDPEVSAMQAQGEKSG